MADEADLADAYSQQMVTRALEEIRQNQNQVKKTGAKTCAECGEKIPDARRKMGFFLCVPCAEETERRKSLFAK